MGSSRSVPSIDTRILNRLYDLEGEDGKGGRGRPDLQEAMLGAITNAYGSLVDAGATFAWVNAGMCV